MIAKSGAMAHLQRIIREIDSQPRRQIRKATVIVADATFALAVQGAAAGRAPSGRKWAPLARSTIKRVGNRQPLNKLSGTLALTRYATTFKIRSSDDHAIYHQAGASYGKSGGTVRLSAGKSRVVSSKNATKLRKAGYSVKMHGHKLPKRRVLPVGQNVPKKWDAEIRSRLRSWRPL